LESVESESAAESDHWVLPVKVLHDHSDAENMSESAQREIQAQREAIARLSSQVFSRSPTKKQTRAAAYEEEEKEGFADSPTKQQQQSPARRGNKLLSAIALTPRKLKSGLSSVLKKQKTGTFGEATPRETISVEPKKEESGVIDESEILRQSTKLDGSQEGKRR